MGRIRNGGVGGMARELLLDDCSVNVEDIAFKIDCRGKLRSKRVSVNCSVH